MKQTSLKEYMNWKTLEIQWRHFAKRSPGPVSFPGVFGILARRSPSRIARRGAPPSPRFESDKEDGEDHGHDTLGSAPGLGNA